MELRFKLGAIVSALALVGGLGVAFAGSAAATNAIRLCATYSGVPYCAETTDILNSNPVVAHNGGNAWDAPSSGKGQINYDGSPRYCMAIDARASDEIRMEKCHSDTWEEWNVIIGETNFGGQTVPAYVYQSVYKSSLCLASPAKDAGILYANRCHLSSSTQNWMLCPGLCTKTSALYRNIIGPPGRVSLE